MNNSTTYWRGLSAAYAALGPPLRPSPADLAQMEFAVADWAAAHPGEAPSALLLGVTPGIAQIAWPRGTMLLAADNSMPMVRHAWPGNIAGQRAAVCADWCALPLRDQSCDLVVGDGSFSCVRYPHAFRTLAAEVRRVLRPDGKLILRAYIQPCQPESAEDLFGGLWRGAFPTFHWFKYRLLMALQQSAECGIAVDDVYRYWAARNIDVAALAAQTGWDAAGIHLMELYRGAATVHTFTTLDELREVLREFFEDIESSGDLCPILFARPVRAAVDACAA